MAEFKINQDVTTDAASVEVTITPTNTLPLGRHRFQLIVIDDSGNKSKADVVEVRVADQDAPTAVLRAPVPTVSLGKSFQLDGSGSFDVGGGRLVRWVWTYLGPAIG